MKKQHLLKTMLLLCALVVGSSYGWATPSTYNFSSLPTTGWSTSGGTKSINSKTWTYSSSTHIGCDGSRIQVGSKNNPQTSAWTISIPVSSFGSGKAITDVTITAYTTENSATYDISVGGTSFKSGSLTTSSATYSTGTINVTSGNIVVTMTGSSTSKAMYLYNIQVTYDDASSDPMINASNVEIDAEDTDGEFSYTITNPVDGKELAAEVDALDTWITSVSVDKVNSKVTFTTTVNDDTENSRVGTIHLTYGTDLASKDITVTQAKMPIKYTVTYTKAQSNGTLVIKKDDAEVASGSSFAAGTVLSILTTPDENYAFTNWQYKREGGNWVTNTSATTYTMTDKNVEFRANFDATYPVNYNVNGQVSTIRYKEGADIDFSAPATEFGGFEFVGWAESTVDGVVVDKPDLVTEAVMGTSEKTYYAVYGKLTETPISATFDASDVSNLTNSSLTWTENATDIELTLSAGQRYTGGTPYTFTVTNGTSNYFRIVVPSGCYLTKIVTTISENQYKINSVTAGSLSTSGTTQTVSFTGKSVTTVDCKATSTKQIRATLIVVDAISVSTVGYCTSLTETISTASGKTYATYVTANALDFSSVSSNIKAYVAANTATSGTITFTGKDAVPANTPLLIKTTSAGATVNVPVIASAASVGTNYLVAGNGSAITYDDSDPNPANNHYYYILTNGQFKAANNSVVAVGKAYLSLPSAVSANELTINFDDEAGDVTGIATVSSKKQSNGEYYNLNGQRVDASHKGIVIVNGKKFFNK